MQTFVEIAGFVLSLTAALSLLYYGTAIFAAQRFFSSPGHRRAGKLLPVSILIPLCGADPEAIENYASFCCQDYPEYQIVFGVRDEDDSSIPVVHELMERFPLRDIQLVISSKSIGQNPKVNNLHNMLSLARNPWLVLADSDIRVGPDYLTSVAAPLTNDRVGLVTCMYRAGKASNIAEELEAIGISGEFAPGVMVAWLTEGVSFALGATVAMRRERLKKIGDFEAVADYLADDYMLGYRMRKAGFDVVLSRYIVETLHPSARLFDMIRHQVRWSRGIRACRPMGHLGSLLMHGTSLAFLNVAAHQGSVPSLLLFALILGARCLMAWKVGVRRLGDGILRQRFWLIPVRDVLGFLVWCAAFVGKKVIWRNQTYVLQKGGRIKPR